MPAEPVIVMATTCRGRIGHLKLTLPRNLAAADDYPNARFLVLDYNSQDGLAEWLRTELGGAIHSGRLVVYSFPEAQVFRMGHAKNLAMRCAMLEGADILVTMDADNHAGPGFCQFIADTLTSPRQFLCPDFPYIKSLPHGPERPQRGFAGRLAIRPQDFLKLGGYDETFETWRGEDIDLIARLQRIGGFKMRTIPTQYLEAIPHNARVRFREYPHARQYETKHEYHRLYERSETVVNWGRVGCGTVYRNFNWAEPITIAPLPTRVFGIGMHKTATTSLHEAFGILGYDSWHWRTNREAWQIYNQVRAGRSPLVDRYQALCDNPIPMLYRELDQQYPSSKFILTKRYYPNWIASVKGLYDPAVNPWYDWDKQPYSNLVHKELYGMTYFHEDTMRARYIRHNWEVVNYFHNRSADLLVMEMDDGVGWRELCNFLDVPQPVVPYPHAYGAY